MNFKHHCQASRGSSPRKPAVEAEEDPQPLGNREDELPVGDGGAQVAGETRNLDTHFQA